MAAFRLAQFSDTHIVASGTLLPNAVDSRRALAEAIARLCSRVHVDALLISGDLVESGIAPEYRELRNLLDALPRGLPVYLMAGNHDRRQPLFEIFADWPGIAGAGAGRRLCYAAPLAQAGVLVVLDSLQEGHDEGQLDAEQLAWLDHTLAAHAGQAVLLAVHHPMIDVGNPMMNAIGLTQPDDLQAVLARHRPPAMILCGHLHRDLAGHFAGAPVRVCPSTAFAYAADVDEQHLSILCNEAPGFLVHHVDAHGKVRSESHALPLFKDGSG